MRSQPDDLVPAGVDGAGTAGPGPGLPLAAAAGQATAAQTVDPAAYPYDTVVRITDQIGAYVFQGSGVLISPDEVLTASHVVYQTGLGTATDIDVTPAFSGGTAPLGHAAGTAAHYSEITDRPYIDGTDSQSDYAVIHLSTPFAGVGAMGIQPNFAGGPVHVTGYPGSAGGALIDSTQTVAVDPSLTLLDGASIGAGSSGGPVWIDGADGRPYVVGLVSAESVAADAAGQVAGTDVEITGAVANQVAAWERQDDGGAAGPSVQVFDATLGQQVPDALTHFYTGPVAGIQEQYVDVSQHNLNIAAKSPNYFIHTGSGNDAVALLGGTNAVDAGAGSNFLAGGAGTDTFYADDRGAASDIWSTVSNFHPGDSATVFGVSPGADALAWADNQGTAGFTGLTLHAAAAGQPTASLTLAGFSQADIASGRLSVQYGHDAGSASDYLYVHDNR